MLGRQNPDRPRHRELTGCKTRKSEGPALCTEVRGAGLFWAAKGPGGLQICKLLPAAALCVLQ